MSLQKTLKAPFELGGPCLWSGGSSRVRVSPAEPDTGLLLRRIDKSASVTFPVCVENAQVRSHMVVLRTGEDELVFVEHLLAALWGMGIDNACVDVDGVDLPFLDGSALPYVQGIKKAGVVTQGVSRLLLEVSASLVVIEGARFLYVSPAAELRLSYAFLHHGLMVRRFQNIEEVFASQIATARTFAVGSYPEFSYPFDVHRSGRLSFPYPARFADEMLRHKVLDLIGDLALIGIRAPLKIRAFGTGHRETHKVIKILLKEVLDDSFGYRRHSRQTASPLSLPDG